MNGQFWWYVARTSGIVAWALAGTALLAQLATTSPMLAGRAAPRRLVAQRGFLAALSVALAGIHGIAVVADWSRGVDLGLADALVPFAAPTHPGAIAWGILALYLLVAVEVVRVVQRDAASPLARVAPWGAVVVFLAATVHALALPGTDVDNPVVWWPAAALSALLVAAVLTHALPGPRPQPGDDLVDEGGRPELPDLAIEVGTPPASEAAPATAPIPPSIAAAPTEPEVAAGAAHGTPTTTPVAAPTPAGAERPSRDVLERARARLASLDTAAYPQAELPPELLTERPAAAAEGAPQPPTRPASLPTLTPSARRRERAATPATPTADAPAPPTAAPEGDRTAPPEADRTAAPEAGRAAPPPAGVVTPTTASTAPAPATAAPEAAAPSSGAPGATPAPAPVTGRDQPPAAAADAAPAATAGPAGAPAAASTTTEPAPDVALRFARLRNRRGMLTPSDPPVPTRPTPSAAPATAPDQPPAWFEVGTRPLPQRAPQRVAATTAAAAPGEWTPQRAAAPAGGPPPPPEPDPATGEVAPEAYRVWLREWLSYAESYDG